MITEQDLQEAIAECNGQKNPGASTCIKLAAFYTIKDHLFPKEDTPVYSFSAPPDLIQNEKIEYSGESDFAQAIAGKSTADVLSVVDELMDTINVFMPQLYAGVIQKLNELNELN